MRRAIGRSDGLSQLPYQRFKLLFFKLFHP